MFFYFKAVQVPDIASADPQNKLNGRVYMFNHF